MGDKRILLADADPQVLAEFRQALGLQWEVVATSGSTTALLELKRGAYDMIVASLDLPGLGGAELLNRVRKKYPKTVRIVLATEADKERVMRDVLGAHQFLTKPLDTATIKGTLERALALDGWISSNSIRELVSRVRAFPTLPTLYLEVLAVIRSPSATTEEVGSIIGKDMAMMTKLLQIINSAYFGLPRRITDPAEAVGLLGFDTVKSMVMAIKLLSQYDKIKPVYFSVDRLWRHSMEVARAAKQITLLQTGNSAMAESAFTAGLLHDAGKVVLAANFDEQYRGVQSLARKQQVPLWEVEREIFGATHGEIGAYLLGLWGMPIDLLEVAALHHDPSRSLDEDFSPLTAVHVANVLYYEVNPDNEMPANPKLDEPYLARIGLLDSVAIWREAIANHDSARPEVKAKSPASETARRASLAARPAPKPAKPTGTKESPDLEPSDSVPVPAAQPAISIPETALPKWTEPSQPRPRLVASVCVAVVLLVLFGWLGIEWSKHLPPAPVAAPGSSATPQAERIASQPVSPGPMAKPEIQATPAPEKVQVAMEPAIAPPAVTQPLVVGAPAPTTAAPIQPAVPAFPELKLQGIFYSAKNPSAIINGQMLHVKDRCAGALIVEIRPGSVTVEYQSRSKKLSIH